jgi:hypothetical protein
VLDGSECGAHPLGCGHGVGGAMGHDWLWCELVQCVFRVTVMQERLLARFGEGARWFPCYPRIGVHGLDRRRVDTTG